MYFMHVNTVTWSYFVLIAAFSTSLFRAQELKLKTQHLQNMFDMFQYQFLKIFEVQLWFKYQEIMIIIDF